MAQLGDVIVGLDIGTTKIAAVIGEITEAGVDVIGVGTAASDGLRQGVVVNIESTTQAITAAIQEAEQMAAVEVQSVYVGIAGGHIRGFESTGQVSMRDREVTEHDVARVLEQAKAINIPLDQQIVHVLPLEYVIDGQGQIRDPIGMSGVRMEVRAHIITAATASVHNLVKCCNRAGLDVVDVVLEPLASGLAVLHEDEMDLGVVLLDIGGGTTDISVWSEGTNVFSSVVVSGGQRVTQDVAHGLRTSVAEAEAIKRRHGCALVSMVAGDETIQVPGVGPRPPRSFERRYLAQVIEPRVEEILLMAQGALEDGGKLGLAASGLVLTGGSAALEGMVEIAEDVFQMPVRLGVPTTRRGASLSLSSGGFVEMIQDPRYATGVGLVLYGARHQPVPTGEELRAQGARPGPDEHGRARGLRRIFERVREMF